MTPCLTDRSSQDAGGCTRGGRRHGVISGFETRAQEVSFESIQRGQRAPCRRELPDRGVLRRQLPCHRRHGSIGVCHESRYDPAAASLDSQPLGRHFIAPLDVHLSDLNVDQPDLLFVAKDNLRIVGEHGIEGAPNLVVEVLSSTSGKYDLGPKRSVYARTGVEELWIVDPARRTLALYRLIEDADTPAATYRAKQKFTSTLLPGLVLDLAVVFAP